MRLLLHFLNIAVLALLLSCNSEKGELDKIAKAEVPTIQSELNTPPDGFEALFNGKNFDGWHIIKQDPNADEELFSVEDGVIRTYKGLEDGSAQAFAELITDREYESFVLSMEYKWGEKKFKPRNEAVRDAGVLFHGFDEDLFWASGAECQIQEGDTGDLWLIGVRGSTTLDHSNEHYAPDGKAATKGGPDDRYRSFSRNWYWEKPGWNKVVLEVTGDKAKFLVNDKLVNEVFDLRRYHEDVEEWKPLTKGKILLQAEGAEIYYRNIYIKTL